ncbi:hypothetical protein T492DRAFT_969885 [Pavlovales sp. CCMP2436]|nr:hypothetical protein T492DRAFT_969885 [Pavlovales sp. CCMP2436]
MRRTATLLCGLALAACANAAVAPRSFSLVRASVRACALPSVGPPSATVPVPSVAFTVVQLKAELRREIASSSTGDMSRVHALCDRLAAAQPAAGDADVEASLQGDWLTLASSVTITQRPSIPLKFLTFGALPMTSVLVDAWYNRVSNGRYTLVPVVRGAEGAPLAGVALSGPCAFRDSARPSVCTVSFESAQLVPALGLDGLPCAASLATCLQLGGEAAAANADMKVPFAKAMEAFIDVKFIDDELRVHVGQSGEIYVLERVAGRLPVLLD